MAYSNGSYLPQELLDLIVDAQALSLNGYEDMQPLAALALTSRALHRRARQHLFYTVKLRFLGGSLDGTLTDRIKIFLSLLRNDHYIDDPVYSLRACIRELHIAVDTELGILRADEEPIDILDFLTENNVICVDKVFLKAIPTPSTAGKLNWSLMEPNLKKSFLKLIRRHSSAGLPALLDNPVTSIKLRLLETLSLTNLVDLPLDIILYSSPDLDRLDIHWVTFHASTTPPRKIISDVPSTSLPTLSQPKHISIQGSLSNFYQVLIKNLSDTWPSLFENVERLSFREHDQAIRAYPVEDTDAFVRIMGTVQPKIKSLSFSDMLYHGMITPMISTIHLGVYPLLRQFDLAFHISVQRVRGYYPQPHLGSLFQRIFDPQCPTLSLSCSSLDSSQAIPPCLSIHLEEINLVITCELIGGHELYLLNEHHGWAGLMEILAGDRYPNLQKVLLEVTFHAWLEKNEVLTANIAEDQSEEIETNIVGKKPDSQFTHPDKPQRPSASCRGEIWPRYWAHETYEYFVLCCRPLRDVGVEVNLTIDWIEH